MSAAVADDVRRGWGFDPTVIPNGVDAERFSAAAESGRTHWQEKFGRYVLAVGGIEPRKGSLDLLDAFSRLADRNLRLVFAGGETLFDYRDYRAEFDVRATELAVEPVILGTVDDDELPHLVAQAAVLPFFSTKEGFGLAAMEALAASTPVVARDLPVLREVFGDSVTYASSVGSMATELERAVREPRDRLPGLALARSLTWDEAARRHLEFYSSLR